jgi:hypothetical protein
MHVLKISIRIFLNLHKLHLSGRHLELSKSQSSRRGAVNCCLTDFKRIESEKEKSVLIASQWSSPRTFKISSSRIRLMRCHFNRFDISDLDSSENA